MYGLVGRFFATPGQREALIAILLDGIRDMPGCLSYVVARDPKDDNAIWVTEVWDREDSHAASLKLPSVQAAIAKAKPLIAGFGDMFVTQPVGGHGLPADRSWIGSVNVPANAAHDMDEIRASIAARRPTDE